MTEATAARDPFGVTADPETYVARPATELALEQLVRGVSEHHRPLALTGPPGLGKTLLLRLLPGRVERELRALHLPYAALPPDELCSLALAELQGSAPDDPVAVFRAYVAHLRESDSGLLLCIDDAAAMPVATARWLGERVAASRGSLKLVLAASDGPGTDRVLGSIVPQIDVVRLIEPMTASETHRYVSARLAFGGVSDDVLARFDEDAVAEIHEISGGIPSRVNAAASAVLRGADPGVYGAIVEDAPRAGGSRARDDEAVELQRLRYAARRAPARRMEPPPPLREVVLAAVAVTVAVAAIGLVRGWLAAPLPELPATPVARIAGTPLPPELTPVETGPPPPAHPPTLHAVHINATPWAVIEVDGVELGPTPLADVPLLGGPHVFRAKMADGRVFERTVEIDAENRYVAFPEEPGAPPSAER